MFPLRLALLWLTLTAIAPASARAQELSEARRLYLDADFDAATSQFELLLSSPGLSRLEAVETHRYLAGLHALAGQEARVAFHIDAALSLDATISAPEGSSPELQDQFENTRRDRGGRMASLKLAVHPSSAHKQLRLELLDAPTGLIHTLALRCVSGTQSLRNTSQGGPLTLELDATSSWNCQAEALTAGRAALISESRNIAATLAAAPTESLSPPQGPPATVETGGGFPWLWLIAGVLAAGAATTTVVLLSAEGGGPEVTRYQVDGW